MEMEPSIFSQKMDLSVHNAVIQNLPSNYHFQTHMHNTVEIMLCTEGVCIVHLQDQVVEIGSGAYILLFPGVLHDTCTSAATGCTFLQTHFYVDIFKAALELNRSDTPLDFFLEAAAGKQKFFKGQTKPRLYSSVDSIRLELQEKDRAWKRMVGLSLLETITLLSRDLQGSTPFSGAYRNKYLMKSLTYINEHYSEPISATDIAAVAGISVRYLSSLFSGELSINLSTYINCVRIQKAIDLMILRPDYPLTTVAVEVGFSSLQYFSRVFKEQIEISPSKYMEVYRKDR